MSYTIIIVSIITGILVGITYGIFFIKSKQKALSVDQASTKNALFSSMLSSVRLLVLGMLFFYLLRLPSIHFIIVLQSFLITFWVVILRYKK